MRNFNEVKPGSAWDTWRKAGIEWYNASWSHSEAALIVASNAFAHDREYPDSGKDARKRAFIEGAIIAKRESESCA